jgi:hypothetical protein
VPTDRHRPRFPYRFPRPPSLRTLSTQAPGSEHSTRHPAALPVRVGLRDAGSVPAEEEFRANEEGTVPGTVLARCSVQSHMQTHEGEGRGAGHACHDAGQDGELQE